MKIILKGGPGSGFHGHKGRPGEVGGSSIIYANQKEYVASLDNAERTAIDMYTGSYFRPINHGLRNHHETILNDIGDENLDDVVDTLDNIIANAPPIEVRTLHRAMAESPDKMNIKVGEVWKDYGYSSTTEDAKYIYQKLPGLKTRAHIKIPKDANGKGITIKSISRRPEEKETLLARGSEYLITKIIHSEYGGYIDVYMELL